MAMIDRVTDESAAILASVVEELDETGTVQDRLRGMARALARGVLNPEIMQLRRLAISTAVAFPASANLYWQRGPATAISVLEKRFESLVDAGELGIPDIPVAAAQFAYSLLGPLQDRSMFEVGYSPSAGDIDRYVFSAVNQLLRGFAAD